MLIRIPGMKRFWNLVPVSGCCVTKFILLHPTYTYKWLKYDTIFWVQMQQIPPTQSIYQSEMVQPLKFINYSFIKCSVMLNFCLLSPFGWRILFFMHNICTSTGFPVDNSKKISLDFHWLICGFSLSLQQIFVGQVKSNEATQKYCIQGIYSAVMAY